MDQDSTVKELHQRIQQLEARNRAHERRESREESTPFSREIELKPLPHRFKVPNIPQYNGDGDPYDHLDAFNIQINLQTSSLLLKCRVFPTTLGEILTLTVSISGKSIKASLSTSTSRSEGSLPQFVTSRRCSSGLVNL